RGLRVAARRDLARRRRRDRRSVPPHGLARRAAARSRAPAFGGAAAAPAAVRAASNRRARLTCAGPGGAYAAVVAFAIAQVSPHPWEARTELGSYVEQVAGELAARGHRVVIVAPSLSARDAAASKRALRAARSDPSRLLGDGGAPALFLAGEALSANGRG